MVNPWKKALSRSRIALLHKLINEIIGKAVNLDHDETLYLSRRDGGRKNDDQTDDTKPDSQKLSRKEKPVHYSGWPAFNGEPVVEAVTEGAPSFDRAK